jgi:hypothetical protein
VRIDGPTGPPWGTAAAGRVLPVDLNQIKQSLVVDTEPSESSRRKNRPVPEESAEILKMPAKQIGHRFNAEYCVFLAVVAACLFS